MGSLCLATWLELKFTSQQYLRLLQLTSMFEFFISCVIRGSQIGHVHELYSM